MHKTISRAFRTSNWRLFCGVRKVRDIAGLREALIEKGREKYNETVGRPSKEKSLLQITTISDDKTPPPPVTFIDHEAIKNPAVNRASL